MATILFYEKPGCVNNTLQKRWLRASGHTVVEKSLLDEAWTASRLWYYLRDVPYSQWFNKSAPAIKSGELDPAMLQPKDAIDCMLKDPLLIRRPLMRCGDSRMVGFDPHAVHAWVGLHAQDDDRDLEACPRSHADTGCAEQPPIHALRARGDQ